jgi:hypothetical protein
MAIQSLIDNGATNEELLSAKDSMIETLTKKIEELTQSNSDAVAVVEEMKAKENQKERRLLWMYISLIRQLMWLKRLNRIVQQNLQ